MKRILVLLLMLLLALTLSACSGDDETIEGPTPTPTVNANAGPTPTPTAAPTATPFPRIDVSDYVMIWKSEPSKGINFMMPTHWKDAGSGERFVIYYEPVPAGENGFRVSISNKKKTKEPDSGDMREELREFLSVLKDTHDNFETNGEISRDVTFVRFKGFMSDYTYTDEYGIPMQGFVVMSTYNRRIYAMNFSGPADRFEGMLVIAQKILENVNRAS